MILIFYKESIEYLFYKNAKILSVSIQILRGYLLNPTFMKINKKIKEAFESRLRINFIRQLNKTDYLENQNGYILDYSEDFVLFANTTDFQLDGYLILPIAYITKIECKKSDKRFDYIMQQEGEFDKIEYIYKIDLTSWTTIFNSLKTQNLMPIIEDEIKGGFLIGEIKEIKPKSVMIHYFNGQGILDKEWTKKRFKEITKIQFDNHYINVFKKYLKKNK
jgi:hypothetical protein